MCNDYRLEVEIASIMEDFDDLEINIETPEGVPEVEARADIGITDISPIVRSVERSPGNRRAVGELVNRRWSWPGPTGKPVYNFRSENRKITSGRCLVLADGFYEFTAPEDPKQKRKTKWLFTMKEYPWFCMAGIWRAHPEVGEAFTLLTMEAGDEIRPYHHRQIVPLARDQWADWLNPDIPAAEVLKYLPADSLDVVRVYPPVPEAPAQASLIV